MTRTYQKVTFNGWTLNGSILSPTHARLQAHTEQISTLNADQAIITFQFPAIPSRTLTIHRSFLISAGGPLKALVTLPFSEATTHVVKLDDTFDAFEIVYKFLYCLPIDLSLAPPEMPLVAHRWQLETIFQACFAWAELSQTWSSRSLVEHWMTVLSLVQPPRRFCDFFARVFGTQFDKIVADLTSRNWMWATLNIWDVFRFRYMLKNVIHFIVQFATTDVSELLLDVILRHLEDKLSEREAIELLAELDWDGGTCRHVVKSVATEKWSARAWRLLALTPKPAQPTGGEDFRMRCTYDKFGADFRNAPVCETRDSFTFKDLSFSISLQSWCWKDPLSLRVEIQQAPESVLRKFGRRQVSAIVCAVDDGCSCGLFNSERPGFEEYNAEPWPHFGVTGLTLDSFARDGGVEYVLMDPSEFEMWRSHHQECGLLVSIRLRIFDEEVDDILERQQKAYLRGTYLTARNTRNRSSSRGHGDCPCVRCRVERRVRGDQARSPFHSSNAELHYRQGRLGLSLLSLS